MPYQLAAFSDVGETGLTAPLLAALLDEHQRGPLPRAEMLWSYYRNQLETVQRAGRGVPGKGYRLAQERGLPQRITGRWASIRPVSIDDRTSGRREVVIENDIAWRVHAMVDFLFGKPIRLISTAANPALRTRIEAALESAWEASGGMSLLQDAGLLGHVHGHVDLIVRSGGEGAPAGSIQGAKGEAEVRAAAALLRVEVVDPARGIPIQSSRDYRVLDGYIVHFRRASNRIDPASGRRGVTSVTEILSGTLRQVYHEESSGPERNAGPRLMLEEQNAIDPGVVPVVHIQNVSQPLAYPGLSEVEPLIPLQDELNTRLSDRACRVTLQSFKMYLAKGIDGFDKFPVGPGTVWSTDNPDAEITEFGGDGASPSEDAHIEQIREAIDKASAVPPLATGVVQAKVGNLSSENALRLTLSGLLARTLRKRLLYGRGIQEVCRLMLAALDRSGALRTAPEDRGVTVQWPDPIPSGELESLDAAKAKRELGVGDEQVLGELGYGRGDVGVG